MVQTKEDKERFFADLERLGTSDTDTESEGDDWLWYRKYEMIAERKAKEPSASAVNNSIKEQPEAKSTRCPDNQPLPPPPSPVKKSQPAVIDLTSPSPMIAAACGRSSSHRAVSPTKTSKKRGRVTESKAALKKKLKKSKNEIELVSDEKRVFKDLVFFFIPNDTVGKLRKCRVQRAQEYGARWVQEYDETVTHVIVEERIEYSECAKAFPDRQIPDKADLIASRWFSECISFLTLKDFRQIRFQLKGAPALPEARQPPKPVPTSTQFLDEPPQHKRYSTTSPNVPSPSVSREVETIIAEVKKNGPLPFSLESGELESFSSVVSETSFETSHGDERQKSLERLQRENKEFQCMESCDGEDGDNPNSNTIAILQEMATYYDRTGDRWRTTAYRKAIGALRKHTTLVATREQALAIPQIGARIADKIEEIVTTNRLRRLENTKGDAHDEALQLFMGIYGVGLKQASQWIAQGHHTLNDLLENANLSTNQRIGIAHYDDFQQRVPRAEVTQHAKIVRQACRAADKDVEVIVGGSYRRGNADSGDIDLIITKSNSDTAHIRALLTLHVIPALTKAGFLKCALAASGSASGTGSKWHGASCLPGSTIWRRIDLLYVPGKELGAALLYFTGNDIFNRSMRLLASKKGMRLNQHGLYKDVMRGEGRARITEGTLLEGQNERRIFEILGVPWREPHERKC